MSSLANGLILLRALSLPEYGLLVMVYGVYSLVDFVAGLALGELIVSRCSEAHSRSGNSDEAVDLFQSYLVLMFCTMAAVLFAAFVVLNRVVGADLLPGANMSLLIVAGATAPFRSLTLTELRIRQDFRKVKHADIVRCCALTSGYVALIGPAGLGFDGALLAYAAANTLAFLFVAPALMTAVMGALKRPDLRPVLRLMGEEGKWQTLRYGVTALHSSSRPWLIGAVAGVEAVAVFDAAKTATGASLDLLPLKEALVPIMSEQAKDAGALRRLYLDSTRWGIILYGAMGAVVALAAPAVFTYVFPQYHAAIIVTEVLALGFVISGFAAPQTALLYALRMQPTYLTTTLLNFALMFVLGVPLMLLMGVTGMAMTLIITSAAVTVLRHRAICETAHDLRIHWRDWFVWHHTDWQLFRSVISRRSKPAQPDESLNAADA